MSSARGAGWRAILVVIASVPAIPASAQSLAARIDRRLDAPGFDRLLWGVAVTDLDGHALFGRNADRLFIPASNAKLAVSVTAAALLGPDFTVTTSLYATGPIVDGVLEGNLVLYGRGDPTLSRRCYSVDTTAPGACDRDPAAPLRQLAEQLRAAGVRAVAGNVVGDGSYFESELVHPAWENYDLGWWYAAPVSGLGFNDNAVDVHEVAGDSAGGQVSIALGPDVGAVTLDNRTEVAARGTARTFDLFRSPDGLSYLATGAIAAGTPERTEFAAILDPARYAALALRTELLAVGITVRGATVSTVDSLAFVHARQSPALAEVRSRPLKDWLFAILNTSQNWFAEMLLKQLGRQAGRAGSWAEGLRVERRFLIDSVGIDSTAFALQDGSGLATTDYVTPYALTQLLTFARRRGTFPVIDAALPVSGQPGSLKERFVGTALAGRVHAKTGTITGVNTLSGFVERADGRVVAFSVMANHHTLGSTRMIAAIDSIVLEIGRP